MTEFSGSYKPLTPADIAKFESANGITLPPSYVKFLLASNGGRPEGNYGLQVPGWPFKETAVSFFFGIDSGDTYDMQKNLKRYRNRMPKSLVPIGDDAGGNILAIQVSGPDAGAIYFWDHENEQENPESRDNVYRVAKDIDQLLASLTPGS